MPPLPDDELARRLGAAAAAHRAQRHRGRRPRFETSRSPRIGLRRWAPAGLALAGALAAIVTVVVFDPRQVHEVPGTAREVPGTAREVPGTAREVPGTVLGGTVLGGTGLASPSAGLGAIRRELGQRSVDRPTLRRPALDRPVTLRLRLPERPRPPDRSDRS